jgi:hypothetical protein
MVKHTRRNGLLKKAKSLTKKTTGAVKSGFSNLFGLFKMKSMKSKKSSSRKSRKNKKY